ncbi:pseudoazurin [Pseudochelatococcus lubricantis]|uniref:Pseudoazurin n=2 Tax=Pseudochelatococcus lubricantis TaxID=1538102 RepID=A0ABX0V5G9_9HYPH|nr:pseudoazurin [Pseudochelatococcus lubricantis]
MVKVMGKAVCTVAALTLLSMPALAEDFRIEMLNKGKDGLMVFEPSFLKVAPGDKVTFVPTDKTHSAETVKGLIPDGAEPFKGKVNEEISSSFTVPGAYLIKCLPHMPMGMVALVVVGDGAPANLDALKEAKLPKKARERLDAAIAQVGQ